MSHIGSAGAVYIAVYKLKERKKERKKEPHYTHYTHNTHNTHYTHYERKEETTTAMLKRYSNHGAIGTAIIVDTCYHSRNGSY